MNDKKLSQSQEQYFDEACSHSPGNDGQKSGVTRRQFLRVGTAAAAASVFSGGCSGSPRPADLQLGSENEQLLARAKVLSTRRKELEELLRARGTQLCEQVATIVGKPGTLALSTRVLKHDEGRCEVQIVDYKIFKHAPPSYHGTDLLKGIATDIKNWFKGTEDTTIYATRDVMPFADGQRMEIAFSRIADAGEQEATVVRVEIDLLSPGDIHVDFEDYQAPTYRGPHDGIPGHMSRYVEMSTPQTSSVMLNKDIAMNEQGERGQMVAHQLVALMEKELAVDHE